MATDSISLLSGIRDSLLSIQRAAALQAQAGRHLSTGRRIDKATDGATAYFHARSLSGRVGDLMAAKDEVSQAASTIAAAADGVRAVGLVLGQMRGLAVAAQAADDAGRAEYARRFNELRTQVDALAGDAGYQGINLLSSGSAALAVGGAGEGPVVQPRDGSASGLGLAVADEAAFDFAAALRQVEAATADLRAVDASLGSALGALTIRGDHAEAMANTLRAGAGTLVAADAGEEAARMISARTRRQLSTTALSIANDSTRSLLALF